MPGKKTPPPKAERKKVMNCEVGELQEKKFNSSDVECPKCGALPGTRCESTGRNHVERGRQARWEVTGLAVSN